MEENDLRGVIPLIDIYDKKISSLFFFFYVILDQKFFYSLYVSYKHELMTVLIYIYILPAVRNYILFNSGYFFLVPA